MGDRIFRQPDGRYAVFSSVVDGFTMFNCTAENIVTYYVEKATIEAKRLAAQAIERADTASYFRLGPQSWEEGVQEHDRHHPDDPVSDYIESEG